MTQTASVYAQALYELCRDEGKDEQVLSELRVLGDVFSQNEDYLRLLSAPDLNKQERCRVLDEALGGRVDAYVLHFCKIMTERGYARYLPECCACYRELYQADHGIVQVTAVTALALSDGQKAKLQDKLSKITGKTVEINNLVDENCVGGVRLDYDGKRVDDTVKNRLDQMRAMLKNTTL